MTRWRVVRCPRGSYAVLSDREPGPILGSVGGLHGWGEANSLPDWSFEAACAQAAWLNGKPSTANMEPQSAAERAGAT